MTEMPDEVTKIGGVGSPITGQTWGGTAQSRHRFGVIDAAFTGFVLGMVVTLIAGAISILL